MRRLPLLALALFGLLGLFAGPTGAAAPAAPDYAAIIGAITAKGEAVVQAYAPARAVDTADALSDLYFEVFEGSGLEADIGARDNSRKLDLEARFSGLISLALKGMPPAEVAAAWAHLRAGLDAARVLGEGNGGSAWAAFLQAFLILIREGFEAMLVVTALVAYVRRSGNADKLRYLYHGVGWAVVASLATAYVLARLLHFSAAGREVVEGLTMLVAAAVLFYVSCWLFAKSEAARWQAYVRAQVDRALSGGKAATLGLAVFLAVYREGAETVLFYQALAISEAGNEAALVGGFAAGLACLLLLYRVMRGASLRLPLGTFFAGTAVLLFALCVVFVGQGMLELQEARWLPATPLPWLPQVTWLGLFPTVETAGAQAVVLAAAVLGGAWLALRRPVADAAAAGSAP